MSVDPASVGASLATPSDRLAHARPAALGGLVGGALGGALGGGVGDSIYRLAPPDAASAVAGAVVGALVWGAASAAAGSLAGLLLTPRLGGKRAARWLGFTGFVASVGAANAATTGSALGGAVAFAAGLALLLALALAVRWLVGAFVRHRALRWAGLAFLALCLAGEVYERAAPPRAFASSLSAPDGPVVQLRSAGIPVLGPIARHHWLAAFDPETGRWHRWEVWQTKDRVPTAWGHVHQDLSDVDEDVGGGPESVVQEWRGDEARRLLAVLRDSERFPERDTYIAWPGPCCNTYVRWVFQEAGVACDLDPTALGKDHGGPLSVATTSTRTGLEVETAAAGVKVGALDGVEAHLLGFTFGADAWPPAVKTPLGRLGFRE
jgi:hypothetical protein